MTDWEVINYENLPDWMKQISKPTGKIDSSYTKFFAGEEYNYQVRYDVWNGELQIFYWRKSNITNKGYEVKGKNWGRWFGFLVLFGIISILGVIGVYYGDNMINAANLTPHSTLYAEQQSVIETIQLGVTLSKIIVIISPVLIGITIIIGIIKLVNPLAGSFDTNLTEIDVNSNVKIGLAVFLWVITILNIINLSMATIPMVIWFLILWYWFAPYLAKYAKSHNRNPTWAFSIGVMFGFPGIVAYWIFERVTR
jgi:hypothetical protein